MGKTISEKVIELLERHRGTPLKPKEIGKMLGLKIRKPFPLESYNWGKWSFLKAEREGLIVWVEKEGKSGWILRGGEQ